MPTTFWEFAAAAESKSFQGSEGVAVIESFSSGSFDKPTVAPYPHGTVICHSKFCAARRDQLEEQTHFATFLIFYFFCDSATIWGLAAIYSPLHPLDYGTT